MSIPSPVDTRPHIQAEVLSEGLKSEFWHLFLTHVMDEWGPGGKRFEQAIDRLADLAQRDPAQTVQHMQQIAVARREILRLLKWPEQQLADLKRFDTAPAATDRRRAPDPCMQALRRGGLAT